MEKLSATGVKAAVRPGGLGDGDGLFLWNPALSEARVSEITGPMIRNVLAEIWLSKPETARRVRQRIGAVLDWAFASGYRETEAPMRSITKGLPRQPRNNGHYAAVPYPDVASFLAKLRAKGRRSLI